MYFHVLLQRCNRVRYLRNENENTDEDALLAEVRENVIRIDTVWHMGIFSIRTRFEDKPSADPQHCGLASAIMESVQSRTRHELRTNSLLYSCKFTFFARSISQQRTIWYILAILYIGKRKENMSENLNPMLFIKPVLINERVWHVLFGWKCRCWDYRNSDRTDHSWKNLQIMF